MEELNWQERTELLLGKEKIDKLRNSHVLVAGLGGVGGHAAEHLARVGIGKLTIIDSDVVHETNINRQLIALQSSIGKSKTALFAERIRDINPAIELNVHDLFITGNEAEKILETPFDYIVDAIDTISPKINLIRVTTEKGYPLVSSMGAGAKTDPSQVKVTDISKSYNCKLAFMIRKRLRKFDIHTGFKVVFSSELPDKSAVKFVNEQNKLTTVGTVSYMPPIFGCYIASVVINDLIGK